MIHVGSAADDDEAVAARPSARDRLLAERRAAARGRPPGDGAARGAEDDDAVEADDDARGAETDDARGDDDVLEANANDDDAREDDDARDDDDDARDDDAREAEANDDEPDANDDEPDANDDEPDANDDEPPARQPPPRRRGDGPRAAAMLLGGATMLWGSVMLMRCRPDGALPPAALPEAIEPNEPAPEAADAAPRTDDTSAPIPAGDRTAQPDATDDMPADDSVPAPRDDWPAGLEHPDTIRYTIRRGGSLENVANLFKIYHHEILAMNPGVGLEQKLAPDTRIVVYQRDPQVESESIGFPSGGSLAGAVPMVEGRGRRILAIPWKTWGTASTIALLDRVLDAWAERGADVQPILVGNISNRTGGRLEPHSTHQSGRDVDLGYPQKLAKGAELNWQEMNEVNLDAAETWALLKLLVETRAVEEIYIDRALQKLLHAHAVATGVVSKSSLSRWMEYPRPTGHSGTVIKHVAGHTDHLHVRFACARGQSRCKSH